MNVPPPQGLISLFFISEESMKERFLLALQPTCDDRANCPLNPSLMV